MKVRTIGTNRASTIVFGPWRSKNWCVRSTYSCLKSRDSCCVNRRGPSRLPIVADFGADERADEAADDEQRDVEVALTGEHTRGEQQRVAGEEEADEQAGLGEDDEPQPDLAVRTQRVDEILGSRPSSAKSGEHGGTP